MEGDWKKIADLEMARAYAASVVKDGVLWIVGGVGETDILDSVETLANDGQGWVTTVRSTVN